MIIVGLEGATGPSLIATHVNPSDNGDCCPVASVALAVRYTRWLCTIPSAAGSNVTEVPGIEVARGRNVPGARLASVVQYAE